MGKESTRGEYVYSTALQDVTSDLTGKETFEEKCTDTGPTIGTRHTQVLLYFLLQFMAFVYRVSLSVGIVAMTDPDISSNPAIPTYPEWKNRNAILSSFFFGYILPQIYAAHVAKRYGAKWFLITTMMIQSFLSILMPWTAATFGANGIMVSRALQGFCQGFIWPCSTHFLSQWAPIQERSRLGSIVFSAGKIGTVASMLLTGLIAASSYGWPVAFYLYGGLGIFWCILMFIFAYDTPRDHPKITESERLFIENGLRSGEAKHLETPWKSILTSVPVWALFILQTGNNYCFWTMLTQIPTYMNYVMGFDMKHNSFWSAVPYLSYWLLSFFFGFICDTFINKKIVTVTTARKLVNSIGIGIPATALIALGFTKANQTTQAVALLIAAVGFNSSCLSVTGVNHMDLSPNHAGSLMGLINGCSQITSILAPLAVQVFVTDLKDPLQWRSVFFTAAGVIITASIVYNIFGSGEIQPWNTEEENEANSSSSSKENVRGRETVIKNL